MPESIGSKSETIKQALEDPRIQDLPFPQKRLAALCLLLENIGFVRGSQDKSMTIVHQVPTGRLSHTYFFKDNRMDNSIHAYSPDEFVLSVHTGAFPYPKKLREEDRKISRSRWGCFMRRRALNDPEVARQYALYGWHDVHIGPKRMGSTEAEKMYDQDRWEVSGDVEILTEREMILFMDKALSAFPQE